MRRMTVIRIVYRTRDISPPRSQAEQPRHDTRAYEDHRTVSPLGSSPFEKPSSFSRLSRKLLSTQQSSRALKGHGAPSHDSAGKPTPANKTRDYSFELRRSGAIRGRTKSKPNENADILEQGTEEARAGLLHHPQCKANFRDGLSNWENF